MAKATKVRLLVAVLLAAGGAGAAFCLTAEGPLDRLLARPGGSVGLGYRDVEQIIPPSNLADCCEPGRVTVLIFVWQDDPGCVRILRHMRRLAETRPDVACRFVELGRSWRGGDRIAGRELDIGSVPHVMIYGPDGRLLAGDDGLDKAGLRLLYQWLDLELSRPREQPYASR